MEELIGLRVDEVWIAAGEKSIHFLTDSGWKTWETDGDCCSETWFADIYGTAALLGQEVITVEKLDLPLTDPERTRQEEDAIYGIGITTQAGKTTIAFRNSSNGYYGGSIYYLEDSCPPPNGSLQILADWSA